jgi:hypothetical protein
MFDVKYEDIKQEDAVILMYEKQHPDSASSN